VLFRSILKSFEKLEEEPYSFSSIEYLNSTKKELIEIRKDLKKGKLPNVFDGMWMSEPQIGGAKFEKEADDFVISWVYFIDGIKTDVFKSSFHKICNDTNQEMNRLRLGITLSNIFKEQGSQILNSIGGPNEAMREASPLFKLADDWYHWAVVPAGFFRK
jgi:hypothetical protein